MAMDNQSGKDFPSGHFQFQLCDPGSRPKLSRSRKRSHASSASITESMMNNAVVNSAPPPPVKVATKPTSDVIAGAIARAAAQSTIHPLDTLKVRLQSVSGGSMPGVSKFGRLVPPAGGSTLQPMSMVATLGQSVASLYKGVVGAASGAGIAIGAYFAVYGVASNYVSSNTDWAPGMVAFAAGGIAAAGSSVVKVPLAVCIRSVQAGVYANVFAAASSIVRAAGPRGLFTGYFPTLLEDVPDMAIKFASYESMRSLHKRLNQRNPSPQEDFAMGAVSGAVAAAATTPLDVIKTNMMCRAAMRPTLAGAAQSVFSQGGPKAFFTGIGTRALSNGINSAVFFFFFEAIRGGMAVTAAKKHQAVDEEFDFEVKPLVIDMDIGEDNFTGDRAVVGV